MKYIGATNFILSIGIKIYWSTRRFQFSQRKYVDMVLQRINMHECKLVKVYIHEGEKLFVKQFPNIQQGVEDTSHIPNASGIENMMYALVYSRRDISREVVFLRSYMPKIEKHHSREKRACIYLCVTLDYAIYYQGIPRYHRDIYM